MIDPLIEIAIWIAEVIFLVALLVMIVRTRKTLGAAWISWGFGLLVLSVLLRRLDDLSGLFGFELINRPASLLLSCIVIGVLLVGFMQVYRRRGTIKVHEKQIAWLEKLRGNDERRGHAWNHL